MKAMAWIQAEGDGPGSFTWACESIDLDPIRVRRMVEQIRISVTSKSCQSSSGHLSQEAPLSKALF